MAARQIPASLGLFGPGDSTRYCGFNSAILAILILSWDKPEPLVQESENNGRDYK